MAISRILLDQYYNFWFSLNGLYDNWAKSKGLTVNSLMTLYMMYQYPEQSTQHFICKQLSLPKQTVNSILQAFEKKGYITKVQSKCDKRSKLLSFTPAGLAYAKPLLQELFALEEQALQQLTDTEQQYLLQSSNHFAKALTQVFATEKKSI